MSHRARRTKRHIGEGQHRLTDPPFQEHPAHGDRSQPALKLDLVAIIMVPADRFTHIRNGSAPVDKLGVKIGKQACENTKPVS